MYCIFYVYRFFFVFRKVNNCNDKKVDLTIDAPKMYADYFEAMIGAVFLDSKLNLEVQTKFIFY